LIVEKIPLFLLSASSAYITMLAQHAGGAVRSIDQFSLGVRISNAIFAYVMYLWKTIWPMRLAPLYPHPGDALSAARVFLSAVVLLAITLIVLKFRSRRYLLVGWLWFLGTLVPVIGLVQVGDAAMADRYAYIPLIGIFVIIAFGTADLAGKRLKLAWTLGPALGVLVGLSIFTARQISYWQSSYDLWSHALAVTQNNFIAENNLGGAFLQRGEAEKAYPHFERAAQINPRDAMSRTNLGAYLQTHGQTQQAIEHYKSAIALTSDAVLLAQTYANLGSAQRSLGDDFNAAVSYKESVRLNTRQFNAWLGLGILARKVAKPEEAMADLSRSIKIQPTPLAYLELGRLLAQANRRSEALDAYKEALMLAPDYADAQHAIASLPTGP
jgi:Tfp pilus assembly protein PilF